MSLVLQSHSGERRADTTSRRDASMAAALVPADADVAVDEAADFGYLLPPSGNPSDYLPDDSSAELDQLGELMVDSSNPDDVEATPDSHLPAILTYWGQFLDHELTARTDRETVISQIKVDPAPQRSAAEIETMLKNARTPRFDLDSVYGGLPIGAGMTEGLAAEIATVISGMRHPEEPEKMRVGTAIEPGPLPDGLDEHRDLPRFSQVQEAVRAAYLKIAEHRLKPDALQRFKDNLPKRAIIGDMRNDENLIVAQFHLSCLRFHNRTIDFLRANPQGWIADFASAQALTRLHYQWLIVEGYLKSVCDPAIVNSVLQNRARHFFGFRDTYYGRVGQSNLGNVLPLEFSVAAYRFGHTMVRNAYDYNANFGRPGGVLPQAPFDELFNFTGGGGFRGAEKLPKNWVIDWARFVTADPNNADGRPAKVARAIDTKLAPPLGDMVKEGEEPGTAPDVKALLKQLARRNLRRGLSLRLPTGQALHAHLKQVGAIPGSPIPNVAAILDNKPDLASFLEGSSAKFHERTPLWFYCLAEAEAAGGNHLGELGSWIVASTFIGCLLADPDSALAQDFTPSNSPLRMPDNTPIDTIEKWMRFALVLE